LAEQFGSFAAYALSTETTPRPASTSLDVARFHAYTGEISFSTDPLVRLYLDGGTVYHAEREGDPQISQVLRDLGVVEADQLERGMVRVGDVEHLGRLFDREPSIDRDAVMVVMETRSEAIVRELANRSTASVSVSAYRHHPSGIHRWFVGSVDSAGSQRPVSVVAQVDRSVVDDLPALEATPPALEIEWTEPDPSGPLPAPLPTPAEVVTDVGAIDTVHADWSSSDGDGDAIVPLGEFHIVWPDGTADAAIVSKHSSSEPVTSEPAITEPAASLPPPTPVAETVPVVVPATSESVPTVVSATSESVPTVVPASPATSDAVPTVVPASSDAAADGIPSFSIAPLQVASLPEPDAAVPDDVVAAVKRALAAIEDASTGRVRVPELGATSISVPELRLPTADEEAPTVGAPSGTPTPAAPSAPEDTSASPVVVSSPVAKPPTADVAAPTPAPAPLGFAPPTPDMRAEAVYERAAAAAEVIPAAAPDPVSEEPTPPAPGRASVVFVDDEPEPAAERRGALRRLIGSLRRRDD
jgi:hypothetical protein